MGEFKIIEYTPANYNLWNNFVANSKNATFLFHRDFMDYHHDRFNDNSLLIFQDEKLVAIFPANKTETTLYSHQGLSYGGFVLAKNLLFNVVLESFIALLKYSFDNSIKTIHIKLLPKIYHLQPCDEIDYLLFKLKAINTRRDLSVTIKNDDKIKMASSNRKRGLKKAIKNNLVIKEENVFDEFWNEILIPNLKQTHDTSPVHSLEEISKLKQKFPKSLRQFNAYKDNKIIAGITIFETKTVAHAQYISANSQKQKLGSLDFLFNHLINEVFIEKPYFDFGISNENQGQNINYGLMNWKESFGGRSIVHDFYKIETKNYKLLDSIIL